MGSPRQELVIDVEDAGHLTTPRSVVTTLPGQDGTQVCRFVARSPADAEPVAVSSTFPVVPLALADGVAAAPDAGWAKEVHAALEEIDAVLGAAGWSYTTTGAHWWERHYTRSVPETSEAARRA